MGSLAGVIKVAAKRAGVSLQVYRHKIAAGLKRCTDCKVWLPADRFGIDRSRWDKRFSRCRECKNRRERELYPARNKYGR